MTPETIRRRLLRFDSHAAAAARRNRFTITRRGSIRMRLLLEVGTDSPIPVTPEPIRRRPTRFDPREAAA